MPDSPDTSEVPPTTGKPEGSGVPKSTEPKPPEQPISPGAQRIIDRINQDRGQHGDPRQALGDVAKEEVVIDMVKGLDGKWVARDPSDPNFFHTQKPENPAGTDANPQASAESKGQQRPRDRWREAGQRNQQKEAQKQQELQNLQADGARLAAFVYTPEGRQHIKEVRRRLAQIVDAAYERSRPKLVTRMPGSARTSADFEMREQATEMLGATKKARTEALLRGADMTDIEKEAYLDSVFSDKSHFTTQEARVNEMMRLLGQLDRERTDIDRALFYLDSEAKPVGQRHLLLPKETLDWYGITTAEAQERFAKGWEGVKAQSLQQSQGRPKP